VRVRARGVASVVKADAVVLATHIPGLKRIAGASPSLGPIAASVASLDVSLPQVVWRLWLDRPVSQQRPAYGAAAGLGLLDAVVLLDRIGTRSEQWSSRSRGAIVELHAYAVPASIEETSIRRGLLARLHAVYPETRSANVVDERFLLKQESPAFRPGSHASRPTVTTAIDGIYLAGDHVKLPFHAAPMERATASGFLAANTILAGWGKRTEPVEKRTKRRGIF
jgi:isorenieratene synthase